MRGNIHTDSYEIFLELDIEVSQQGSVRSSLCTSVACTFCPDAPGISQHPSVQNLHRSLVHNFSTTLSSTAQTHSVYNNEFFLHIIWLLLIVLKVWSVWASGILNMSWPRIGIFQSDEYFVISKSLATGVQWHELHYLGGISSLAFFNFRYFGMGNIILISQG